jgi:hypothetical protein
MVGTGFLEGEERLRTLSAARDPVRTVSWSEPWVKIGLADLAYNLFQLAWLNGQALVR